MCGIVGYISTNPSENDRYYLFKLIRQSQIRGMHSYGLAWYDNSGLQSKKYYQNEFKTITIPESNAIIFHNRYSTSGDFKNHLNNQPIMIDDMALAFNGVIDMRTKEEMQLHWGVEMQTENDGELVLIKSKGNPEEMLNIVRASGSFSGVVLKNEKLFAITNGRRPMWQLIIGESVFIASTKDIFIRALGDCNPHPVEINTLNEWSIK